MRKQDESIDPKRILKILSVPFFPFVFPIPPLNSSAQLARLDHAENHVFLGSAANRMAQFYHPILYFKINMTLDIYMYKYKYIYMYKLCRHYAILDPFYK